MVKKMTIGEKIKKLRLDNNMTLEELGGKVGVSKQSLFKYENGIVTNIPLDRIEKLGKVLGVDPSELVGWSNVKEVKLDIHPRKIPILGKIAAGTPILAVENHEDYFDTSEFINADFALQIQGDSMIGSRIYDGDIVFLKKQSFIDNGQIGAFLIDGEATLKIFNKQNNTVMLLSSNPNYSPIILNPEKENIILGKLIGVYSRR
jgi:repressor LexA